MELLWKMSAIRRFIEIFWKVLLITALIEDANKLKHMLGNDGKRMLTVLMSRIEIMMLKRILRAIYTGIPAPSRAFYRLYAPKTYSSNKHLDPYKCIRAKDFHQLIDVLRGSG